MSHCHIQLLETSGTISDSTMQNQKADKVLDNLHLVRKGIRSSLNVEEQEICSCKPGRLSWTLAPSCGAV